MAASPKPGKKLELDTIASFPKYAHVVKLATPPRPAFGLQRVLKWFRSVYHGPIPQWVEREIAMASRFTPSAPYDLQVWAPGWPLFCFEIKNAAGTSLPYSGIRDTQIKGLTKAASRHAIAGFLIRLEALGDPLWFLPIAGFLRFRETHERKSLSAEGLVEFGVQIAMTPGLRGARRWAMEPFLESEAVSWSPPARAQFLAEWRVSQ